MLLTYNLHTKLDALIADEDSRASYQFSDLMLTFAAKRTIKGIFRLAAAWFTHLDPAQLAGKLRYSRKTQFNIVDRFIKKAQEQNILETFLGYHLLTCWELE